ncbi:bifunctional folylpolyglutamate synthase/dihydrofolate synthase, partial [candidate division KSB1 bacterium]
MKLERRYRDIINNLYNLTGFAIKICLDRVEKLLNSLGNPHKKFKSILIAGTNGKGSTSAIIESILREAGYKTGLFTSPHLVEFTERIKVNGKKIKKGEVVKFVDSWINYIRKFECTFFEATTSMAFKYFYDNRIDIAVVEVGMGGRLDATNVLTPILSVITPIGYEHQKYLGESLLEIAAEKAGIIKNDNICITGIQLPEVEKFLRKECEKKGTYFYNSSNNSKVEILFFDIYGTKFNY